MSETPALSPDEQLAAEYALGLLHGEELLAARARLVREPSFVDAVARWEHRFAPLLDDMPEAEPPASVWAAIEAAAMHGDQSGQVVELAEARRKATLWRRIGIGASGIAAVLAVMLALGPAMQSPTPIPGPTASTTADPLLAASIPIADTDLRLALTYVPERGELSVSSAGLSPDGVHDHELWLVDRQGSLHSLGVIVPGEEARFAVADRLEGEILDGSQLVLTREPLGGKPDGVDAGPVVAQGEFRAI
ncbi:anti-sigma factor [Aurantiacibacter gangjinensis]|uniref:anti-sigma factor n=1 Tax=Aurantiacibacter gangjinensis TaxID=502682 RepID=UPI00069C7050|nr:anti-sigma factor [Aurantiacibacter gangjinensis]APE27127.1 hypothetical protein BMF35_a0298 [Aurantiacibacter gangjinensis]